MMSDLALYVHIPFCASKCRYCDFLSFADRPGLINRYMEALADEISDSYDEYGDRYVSSIYIGGGTPSLIPEEDIGMIFERIRAVYDLRPDAEISIEVNPGSADSDKLAAYRSFGINRLSIGLQSANDDELARIGRIHTRSGFENTYRAARECGFDNINIDLIFSLPGQDKDTYEGTLKYALDLKPEHISAYSMQLEEGTYLYEHSDEYEWPDEDEDRDMYHMSVRMMGEAGYDRYEISNFARPGYECRHNIVYWRGGEYLGFGIGAASYAGGSRFRNTEVIEEYLRGVRCSESTRLSEADEMSEFMFLGLRMSTGVRRSDFLDRFGKDMDEVYGHQISGCVRDGLMCDEKGTLFLTEKGFDISNYVFAKFI